MKWIVSNLALSALFITAVAQEDGNGKLASEESGAGVLDFQLVPTMPDNIRISSNHGAEYNSATRQIRYNGGVQVDTDTGMQLFADRAILDSDKKLVFLSGGITIYQGTLLHRGDRAVYDYANNKLSTEGLRTSMDPILLDSGQFSMAEENGQTIYIGQNAGITTHDVATPNYWLRASEIKVYPNDQVTFRHLKLYIKDTPVFWLPYLAQPLDSEQGYHFLPGAKSNWGAFLLNRYGIMLGGQVDPITGKKEEQWLLAQYLMDIRSKRGLGTGVDFFDTRLNDNENLGWLKLYYTNDLAPSTTRSGFKRGFVNEDRYRAEFKQRFEIETAAPGQTLFDINLTLISDAHFLEDFEPRAFNTNPHPDNTIGIQHRREYDHFGAFTRIQLNDFYQVDTRLPEIYYDRVKHSIFNTGILYESQSSLGFYREEPIKTAGVFTTSDFGRLHTYHEFSYPLSPFDGLSIIPRAGTGYTQYWSEGEENRSHGRHHLYAGVDAAIKFSKHYPNVHNQRWGLDGLLHVIQPYTSLSVLSTDAMDPTYTRIDRLTASERPRPFDVGRFNAIDDLNDWSIVRLGVRNQLLTKRDSSSHTWLTMDTYIDAFLNDPEGNRDLSNIYNDIMWDPLPWMSLGLQTQLPVGREGFKELSYLYRFMPTDDLEINLRHSYLSGHPSLRDSSRMDIRNYYRINNDWGLGTYHQWEFDDSTLERQEYSLHRNFESWTVALGLFKRDNRIQEEYGMLLNFSLRALPSLSLPLTYDTN